MNDILGSDKDIIKFADYLEPWSQFMKNPLLSQAALPAFDRIKPEHIEPAIREILAGNRARIGEILNGANEYSWQDTIRPIEELGDRLNRAWSPVNHLHSVADNEALRKVYNNCLPELSDYATEMGQNRKLFDAYKTIIERGSAELDPAQKKVLSNGLRDFRLSGIDLSASDQARYREIQKQLSSLTTRFEENLLDATHAWTRPVSDKDQLAGLPEPALQRARQEAQQQGKDGWLLTLDAPCYIDVMQYADNASLRREMYRAYNTRASEMADDGGEWDNSGLMREILQYRTEKAKLLGFESYAHYSLATKMAQSPAEVLGFLDDLAARSRPAAQRELEELQQFAKDKDGIDGLNAWDIAYYSEQLRTDKFAVSKEMLRPYFPLPQVLQGLFDTVNRLYGLAVSPRSGVPVWHKDVRFFEIRDEDAQLRGSFYLDPYARKHKRGGAWMDECAVRRRDGSRVQHPVAYLNGNFAPPIGDKPALLTHDEVITLFHEFGHGLHHMLTKVDYADVSGINGVEWDAVELPSQFMENWCWEREALDLFARHMETGDRISDELYKGMRSARSFQAGMQMVRQLEFALFDFRLHLEFAQNKSLSIQELLDRVRQQVAVIIPPAFNRFQNGFSHIFAGGYAAGYYSYKWAEVLSADAFSQFEERGIFDRQTGRQFLENILERGGSEDAMELFIRFRGRKPSIEPLLRHTGIAL